MNLISIETLNEYDRQQAEDWFCSHFCEHPSPNMTIEEHTDGGIGVATYARCSCNEYEDLTDYAQW